MLDKITSLRTWWRSFGYLMGGLPYVRLWYRAWHAKKRERQPWNTWCPPYQQFRTTTFEPCFAYTGVYYFGPLNVKKGRSVVKRWGAIFTCMNSRKKKHQGLVTSLESDCFINFFRRFVNTRGPPQFIFFDNGTNFVGAEREIRQAIENWNQYQNQRWTPAERVPVGVSAT